MENTWFQTADGIIALLSSAVALLIGLITVISKLIPAIKTIIKNGEWRKISELALAAMAKAEKSGLVGKDKKAQVIEAVKAGCLELNIDASAWLDDLNVFIDNMITFANGIKKPKTKS